MCEQCVELETKITHYRTFLRQGFDPLTEHRIKELIADLERQKHFMHHRIKIRRRAFPPTPWKWEVYDDRKFKTVTGSAVAYATQEKAHAAGERALAKMAAQQAI